jgi:anterior pharynx defective protein 1
MVSSLELVARNRGHRLSIIDKLYLALGWGYGHGACHVLFFFVSLLSLTTGEGTFYAESCPQMSIFLVSALHSLAFGMVLVAIMVVALEGYHTSSRWHVLYAPAMHLLCALLVGAPGLAGRCSRLRQRLRCAAAAGPPPPPPPPLLHATHAS